MCVVIWMESYYTRLFFLLNVGGWFVWPLVALSEKDLELLRAACLTPPPSVVQVWEGKGAVKTGRVMLGETNPANSLPGTIRGDFCIDVGKNIIHGSDSVESANKEISLWFKEDELVTYTSCAFSWLY